MIKTDSDEDVKVNMAIMFFIRECKSIYSITQLEKEENRKLIQSDYEWSHGYDFGYYLITGKNFKLISDIQSCNI